MPSANGILGGNMKNTVLLLAVAALAHSLLPGELNAADAAPRHTFESLDGQFVAEQVLQGISQPTAIEFLPDGRALVLQRDRGLVTLADFNSGESADVGRLPKLVVKGDAGVHDVELHPAYERNGWIYIAYTEGEVYHNTAVIDRFRLDGTDAKDVQRIFTADAYAEAEHHYAARIQFSDGFLYFAIGDRQHPPMAQDNTNHAGTVVRLNEDGTVPEDNPFVDWQEEGKPTPRPEIWSYGHRDPMGF
jgi:glucose/arabinose dehydrogenase